MFNVLVFLKICEARFAPGGVDPSTGSCFYAEKRGEANHRLTMNGLHCSATQKICNGF